MITASQMKEIEALSGISKLVLMERAGKSVFDILTKKFKDLKKKTILIVCYHGNNGGDGFVAARYLADVADVTVLFLGDESKLSENAKINFKKVDKNELLQLLVHEEDINFDDFDIIIDSILGIGFRGTLTPQIITIVDHINNSKAFKLSIDTPTGLDSNNGIYEKIINADLIITFHDIKKGLEKFKDKVEVVDIGLKK